MDMNTKAQVEQSVTRLPESLAAPVTERFEMGRSRRSITPRKAHADWSPPPERDMLALVQASNLGRVETLIPIRHTRMAASAFTFYRGAPAVMAYDLAHTPSSGITAQLCGDCHISNFGLFASPERNLVFDLNDFDETLPGPFEWDVKRMAASIVVAAQNAGFSKKEARTAVRLALQIYREKMVELASRSYMRTWYSRIDTTAFMNIVEKKYHNKAAKKLTGVQNKNHLAAFAKLTEEVDGKRRIVHNPPLIYRLNAQENEVGNAVRELFTAYYESLEDSRRRLLSRYRFVDLAHKVVGVGSVGTRCFISLWLGVDDGDPLFLQVKQARQSLLEPYLGASEYDHPGKRVITGQRFMQATNDIFLGYGRIGDETYFVRQLYDMKGSVDLETIPEEYLTRYSGLCGAVLARAHARTGDPAQIAGYIGGSESFDRALTEFAFAYAEQNRADWNVFKRAIESGMIPSAADKR